MKISTTDIEKCEAELSILMDNMPKSIQYLKLYGDRTNGYQDLEKRTYRTEYREGIKEYDSSTIGVEGVEVFLEKIKPYKEEYCIELKDTIGEKEYNKFNYLLKDWVDGKSVRDSFRIQGLKKDIFDALMAKYRTLTPDKLFTSEDVSEYKSGGLSCDSIISIMKLNREYLDIYMKLVNEIPDSEYMLFRGLNVGCHLNLETNEYREKKFLTSFSFSPSLAEQFAVTGKEKRVLIKGELSIFQDRIIATSLLHSSLKEKQLEVLVCPYWMTLELKKESVFDGIEEYILQYSENYKGEL
jgi:hypothetical protein